MTESDLAHIAKQSMKHETNQIYEPVVFTSEVTNELGASEKEAHEARSILVHQRERGQWSQRMVVKDGWK